MRKKYPQIKFNVPIKMYLTGNKKFNDVIQKQVNNIVSDISMIAQDDAAYEVKFISESIFELIIDQYYSYRTVGYDRHGEGIGTGSGWNLYDAQIFTYDGGLLNVDIAGRNMTAGYKSMVSNYVSPSKDDVFDFIWSGRRSGLPWVRGDTAFNADISYKHKYKDVSYNFRLIGQPEQYQKKLNKTLGDYFQSIYSNSFIRLFWKRMNNFKINIRW